MICNTQLFRKESNIYGIKCLPTDKVYVGSSVDTLHRFICHRSALEQGKHYNTHLQAAYNKYGATNFEFYIIQPVANKSNLRKLETDWIRILNTLNPAVGYNIQAEGVESIDRNRSKPFKKRSGYRLSTTTRERMSQSRKGRKLSKETIAKSVATRRQNFKGLTDNQRANLSKYWGPKGVFPPQFIGKNNHGHKHTQETKDKMRASFTGKYWGQGLSLRKPIMGTDSGTTLYFESLSAATKAGYNNISRAIKSGHKVSGLTWQYITWEEYGQGVCNN